MFTSRAEYRLLLRHDNADSRLMKKGYRIGLLDELSYRRFCEKKRLMEREASRLKSTRLKPSVINEALVALNTAPIKEDAALEQLLKRPEVAYDFIQRFSPPGELLSEDVRREIEIRIKYNGYILRQMETAEKLRKMDGKKIPEGIDYSSISGLSKEIVLKLEEVRPANIGQAGRIPGVTPAAISLLLIAIEKGRRARKP
jgi:tRNA uridine 5-carboxymethylaminomethyl modification enzyme